MIYDRFQNHSRYLLNERFRKAFEFLENYKEGAEGEPGRYDVCDGVYATVRLLQTAPLEEREIEAHSRNADIHYIIKGSEQIGLSLNTDGEVLKPYNAENDMIFYKGHQIELFPMKPGYFMVIFPNEKHAPAVGNGEEFKKITVKVQMTCE